MSEIKAKDIKPKFTVLVEDYNVPLSPWYIINDGIFNRDIPKMSNYELKIDNLFVYERGFVQWGPVEKQFIAAGDYFYRKTNLYPDFLKQIYNGHYDSFKEINKLANFLLTENLKNKSNKQLFKIYNNMHTVFAKCWIWGMIIMLMDMSSIKISDRIYLETKDKLKKFGNPKIVFSKITTPIKENELNNEILAVLKLISRIQNNKHLLQEFKKSKNLIELPANLQSTIKKLAKEFGWLQYYYLGPAAGPEYYYDLIKKRMKRNADKEIETRNKERDKLIKFQQKGEALLTKEELGKVDMLREFAYLKEVRKEIQTYYLNNAMHNWYTEFARRFYLTPLQVRYIFRKEFKNILVDNKMVVDNHELNERYNCCAYILENGKANFYTGQKAREFKKLFIQTKQSNVKNIKEIKGSVAYSGRAKGIVKIVNSTSDLDKFNEGDILVSFATNPSLVPAMNKAKAIITNTGGVTCHAAIVARELKIPCVIGTKVATQIFKDGDLVEVDATKGIIKKI